MLSGELQGTVQLGDRMLVSIAASLFPLSCAFLT